MVNFGRVSTFVLLNILLNIPFCLTTLFKLFNDSQMLSETYVTVDAASPTTCCLKCDMETACNSVSFNRVLNKCSLSESTGLSLVSVDAPGYRVFYKGKSLHNSRQGILYS